MEDTGTYLMFRYEVPAQAQRRNFCCKDRKPRCGWTEREAWSPQGE